MMPAWKAAPVPLPICTFVVVVFATTCTATVDWSVPAVAVTLIVRSELSPAVTKVATAAPEASVVAGEPETPPEEAVKTTGMPDNKVLFPSRTNAVIVTLAEPSDGIVGELDVEEIAAAAAPPPPPPPPPPPLPPLPPLPPPRVDRSASPGCRRYTRTAGPPRRPSTTTTLASACP